MNVLWPDARVESVNVSYDAIQIELVETSGRRVTVLGVGHIGFAIEGFWDEVIVQSASIVESHPFAERCWASIVSRQLDQVDSGSIERNQRSFSTLVATLIDGSQMFVAAARFETAHTQ
jgi:hypothetical protein